MHKRELDPCDAATWPEFLTTDEAAAVLHLRPQAVRRLLASATLPGRRVGKGYRIAKTGLIAYIGAASSAGPPEPATRE